MYNWWTFLATLGPIGFLPCSGTCATLLAVPLIVALACWGSWVYGGFLLLLLLVGWKSISITLDRTCSQDPSYIVLDEVIGTLFVFWGIKLSFLLLVVGVILFRLLDIYKPGFSCVERLPRAAGVMGDDMVAGMVANGICRLILIIFSLS